MFEKIVLRRSEEGPPLTIGELAEALLFYQNVHLVLDHSSLNGLIASIGMQRLLGLLARPNISAVYCEETLGTRTERIGTIEHHSFIAFYLSGSQEVGQLDSRKKRFEYVLTRHGYGKREARQLVERFRRKVPVRKLTGDYFLPGGIVKAASEDIHDQRFVHEAMRRVLSEHVGAQELPGDFQFDVIPTPTGFHIASNLDFGAINAARKRRQPDVDDISPAHLINEVLMARADTALAAHYGGEFYTSALSSQIIRFRYGELLRRVGIGTAELRELKEIVVSGYPSIREVIDKKERTFDEFLGLLDKSQRFRDWIRTVNPDEKLVQAYLRDVTAQGWINTLPSKAVRYVLASAIDLVAPLAGKVLSAADSFL